MAPTLVDRWWRDSAPETVEHDLSSLWRDVSSRGAVARAVMSNLVVFRLHERRQGDRRAPEQATDVEAIIALHPSRAIVIEQAHGVHAPGAPIGAGVAVCVFGSPAAQYGVEQVLIESASGEASLPSIVRRFVRGDVPTSVWWTEDLSQVPPLASLVTMGRQLIYDSRCWQHVGTGIQRLAPLLENDDLDLADLNWRRLTALRRALADAARALPGSIAPPDVSIVHRGGDEALALLLAGWLAARLRWERGAWPAIALAGQAESGEHLVLTITARGGALRAVMNDHRVEITAPDAAPLTVPVPDDSEATAIAAELRSLSFDSALRETLEVLVRGLPNRHR